MDVDDLTALNNIQLVTIELAKEADRVGCKPIVGYLLRIVSLRAHAERMKIQLQSQQSNDDADAERACPGRR